MKVRAKLERLERMFSTSKVYTEEDREEIIRLPDNIEILYEWGNLIYSFARARARLKGEELPEYRSYVRKTRTGELKAFFRYMEELSRRIDEIKEES